MDVFERASDFPRDINHSAVSIGNFDGLHLGHRALIQNLRKAASQLGVPSIVMTFSPHPMQVLKPERHMKLLFDQDDQKAEMARLGVDYLIIEAFSREFSELSPESFVQDRVFKPLRPKVVCVGYDFAFGARKTGSIDYLTQKGVELGFETQVLPPVKIAEQIISSSKIRELISEGNVALASQMLSRNFYIRGIVERGAGRGRGIGIPTANLKLLTELQPKPGVYCGWVEIKNLPQRHKAVVNIGYNPTFTNPLHALTVECHLLDFEDDIYGREIRLEFVQRLREEKKFQNITELVHQIHNDITRAREVL